ncbi:MAG: tetratricopeptide repeat protein [Pseudomonadota bacterium]
MSDLVREVDEDLRREQLTALWKKYGRWMIAAALGLIVAVAVGEVLDRRKQDLQAGTAEQLADAKQAFDAGNLDTGYALVEEVKSRNIGGYTGLAYLLEAQKRLDADDEPAALQALDALANSNAPEEFKSLGRFLATVERFDTMNADEVRASLEDLANEGSPWFGSANELIGTAMFLEDRMADAELYLNNAFASPNSPPAVRERTGALLLLVRQKQELEAPDQSAVSDQTDKADTQDQKGDDHEGHNHDQEDQDHEGLDQ